MLEDLCRQHPGLANALRERLDLLERLGFVDASPPQPTAPLVSMPERLGGYRLLERLGHGGMGVVYLAEQESLGRRVALKVIQAGALAPPRARERFRREVQAISLLDHPNICPVYDAGEIDGVPYLAMRYVEGETLEARIERERTSAGNQAVSATDAKAIHALVAMGEQLALALHAAHEKGLVHRDVKPANVMLEAATGKPLLLDFGLARLDDGDTPTLTLSGDRLGTPAYMAPEQVAGLDADRRTDVYALGATLYEALTRRLPHEAATHEALYRRILSSELIRASRHNSRIPRDLDIALGTALDPDPNRRYATAADFAVDLGRVLRREPILARPLGPWLRTRRWCQRNRVASSVLAVLAVGLAMSAYLLVLRDRALLEREVALKIAEVESLADKSPREATRLALQAHDRLPGPQTLRALHRQVARDHEIARCGGHGGVVWFARFSPDGQRIVTCSDDGTAWIWSLDGRQLAPLNTQVGWAVHDACFSPVLNPRQVATACTDGSVRIWSENGHELHRFQHPDAGGRRGWMGRVRYSPSGDVLLLLAFDGRAWLWWPETDDRTELVGHGPDMLWDGAFSPDGRIAATTMGWGIQIDPMSDDYTARLWNVADGTLRATLQHRDEILDVAFSNDRGSDTVVVTASFDGTAKLWDLDGKPLQSFQGHRDGLLCANFSPDNRLVVTGSLDRTARLWDAETGKLQHELWHEGFVMSAEFSTDGQRVLTADVEGVARIWDLQGHEVLTFRGHEGRLMGARFSPDGELVATASFDRTARVWRARDRELPRRVGSVTGVRAVATGPKQAPAVLAAAGVDGMLLVWEPGLSKPRRFEHDRLSSVLIDPAGEHIITSQENHTVTIWRRINEREPRARVSLKNGAHPLQKRAWRDCSIAMLGKDRILVATQYGRVVVLDLDGQPAGLDDVVEEGSEIVCAAAHPDGTRFAIGTWRRDQGWVRMFDMSGEPVGPALPPHSARVASVAFSPDGRYLASASDDRTARIWDLSRGGPPRELTDHASEVIWVGFSPAGDQLATTSRDGTARLWKLTGEPITTIDVTSGSVLCGAYSADGKTLFTATSGGLVLSWKARPRDLVDLVRQRATELR